MFQKYFSIVSSLVFLLFTTSVFAQNNWQTVSEKQNVTIQSKKADCNDVANGIHKELILLKFENKNSFPVNISFRKELWYNGNCINCNSNSNEHIISVTLKPNEILEGNCKSSKQLQIFSKMLNLKKSELSHFELKDITVNPVK